MSSIEFLFKIQDMRKMKRNFVIKISNTAMIVSLDSMSLYLLTEYYWKIRVRYDRVTQKSLHIGKMSI